MNTTMIKTQNAQPMGVYQPTMIDAAKQAADFRIINVNPYYIAWKDGGTERVTKRQLETLQAAHTYATDF